MMKRNNGIQRPSMLKISKKYNGDKENTLLNKRIKKSEQKDKAANTNSSISEGLDDNMQKLKDAFADCFDFEYRSLLIGTAKRTAAIAYLDGMVDKKTISSQIIETLVKSDISESVDTEGLLELMTEKLISVSDYRICNTINETIDNILIGFCILLVDGMQAAVALSIEAMETRAISDAKNESIIIGPQDSFVEKLSVSITQIRRRLKTNQLKMEQLQLGKQSKTKIVVAYLKGIVDMNIVKEVKKKLNSIDTDIVLDGGQLQPYLEESWISPFPQTEYTERPDTGVAALAEGRVVILVEGTPFILIVPTTFTYLFTSPEDYYGRFYFAIFVRTIRYLAFFMSIFGPSLYIAITTFHPEFLPSSLLITIANARSEVPFPAVLEALLMEGIFEVIREAGARQPLSIGQALNIVGALVVGQLSVQAGLVSPSMIIVVSVTGLSSFLIPKINSSREISLLRFPLLFVAGIFGIFGLIMSMLVLMIHIIDLRSFGVPYMSPLAPIDFEGMKDTIIKFPEKFLTKRPSFLQKNNMVRKSSGNR